jgi:predicted NACHT family NTPase
MSRSLRASEAGIKHIKSAMKQGGFTQKALAEALGISRSVITVLFRGEAIDRSNFEELCKFLELDWQDIRGDDVVSDDLELLVQEVKQKIAADVTDRCGTMRVLDMTEPVDLDRIYTDVNIIKDVSGRRRIGYDEVMEVCTREHFDRFLVGTIQKRVTGLKAVDEIQKLVVLGKPGAGKTTFMKYLAMSCLGNRFHGELVPIFVTLKAYAEERGQPSLENYIVTEFQKRDVSLDVVMRLLKEGRALILLDGLDEVKKEDDRRVKQDIDQFSRDWLRNRFAITCRIAAREYQFEKFTEVEVADFDDGQIETFVNNWFRERDGAKAERLLERLRGNKPVKELATNPLLLTLLCLVFGERSDFPPKRSELYKEGLEVLMKKWDAKRNIEREIIYKHLSPQNKEDMLGQIAFNTFVNGEYFFRQEDLQRQIKDYICNLSEASADPDSLRLDSEVVLKAIEHHHGLLVERARNIYSFSHLTFQEYFAAREIEREHHIEILMLHITEPRWGEVFLLTAEMLRRADLFLYLMKEKIDEIISGDKKLQAFLLWAKQKADVSYAQTKYTPQALRAFYASVGLYSHSYLSTHLEIAHHISRCLAISLKLDFDLDRIIARVLKCDSAIPIELDLILNDILNNNNVTSVTLDVYINKYINPALDMTVNNLIRQALLSFKSILIGNQENLYQWWRDNRELQISKLRQVCLAQQHIGHDWQFTNKQSELLEKYYKANFLLFECMNQSYVSKQVREEIESTMLLPSKK